MNRLEKIYQLATELRAQIVIAISEGLYFYPRNSWSRDEKILKGIADWALAGISNQNNANQEESNEDKKLA